MSAHGTKERKISPNHSTVAKGGKKTFVWKSVDFFDVPGRFEDHQPVTASHRFPALRQPGTDPACDALYKSQKMRPRREDSTPCAKVELPDLGRRRSKAKASAQPSSPNGSKRHPRPSASQQTAEGSKEDSNINKIHAYDRGATSACVSGSKYAKRERRYRDKARQHHTGDFARSSKTTAKQKHKRYRDKMNKQFNAVHNNSASLVSGRGPLGAPDNPDHYYFGLMEPPDGESSPPESTIEEIRPGAVAISLEGAHPLRRGLLTVPLDSFDDELDQRPDLAVAAEVDTDFSLPAAVQYDANAKPPIYKNRRFQLYSAFGVLLLACIIVGVVLGAVLGGSNGPKTLAPTATPTLSPTSVVHGKVLERFLALVGDDVIIEGTPAYKAAQWILNEDPMQLDETAGNLEQRFLLAMFYYSTTQKSDWRTCGKPKEGEDANCMFDAFGFGVDPDNYETEFYTQVPAIRWLSGESECDWVGSLCDTVNTVRALDIWGNNITGPLPDLSKFHFLRSVSLSHNDFTGTIPASYFEMRFLNNLELHYNLLTGTIPPDFFSADVLLSFNVGDNLLDGPITGTEESNLANLEELLGFHVFDNSLTGPFPSEIGTLKHLSFSRIHNNDFDLQPLPTELGQLTRLKELWVNGNSFTGTIPTEIGLATSLTDLRLSYNQLTGPIPESLYTLKDLESLFLQVNMLTGTLSSSVGRLVDLVQIRLQENKLSGKIPSELGMLYSLELARLHRNLFTGPMPDEICANVGCIKGRTQRLQYLNADCTGNSPANPCSCCTACCERGEGAELCWINNVLDCN